MQLKNNFKLLVIKGNKQDKKNDIITFTKSIFGYLGLNTRNGQQAYYSIDFILNNKIL